MCEFCDNRRQITLHRRETDSNITDCFIATCSDGSALFLNENAVLKFDENGKPYIEQDNSLVYMDINFCPICGKKLGDEQMKRDSYKPLDDN